MYSKFGVASSERLLQNRPSEVVQRRSGHGRTVPVGRSVQPKQPHSKLCVEDRRRS
jgi:hypothetical protein